VSATYRQRPPYTSDSTVSIIGNFSFSALRCEAADTDLSGLLLRTMSQIFETFPAIRMVNLQGMDCGLIAMMYVSKSVANWPTAIALQIDRWSTICLPI
jgi:hypothetical protein